jgi:hypothetical protein
MGVGKPPPSLKGSQPPPMGWFGHPGFFFFFFLTLILDLILKINIVMGQNAPF